MPASFEVRSAAKSYRVEIGTGLLPRLAGDPSAILLADERFEGLCREWGRPVVAVPARETTKSLDAMSEVVARLREAGATRDTHLAVIGGGVVQDVGAFVASIFMRGLAWSYMPTTLLGMADSCIGGKSSINVGKFKNLVGTIHSPDRVLVDTSFIASLPTAQRADGLCEAAKICFARGTEDFAAYLAEHPTVDLDADAFARIVTRSLTAKKWFIERDEFDKNERLLLNFGHTFGHALEGASAFSISHGAGVGLGILCAMNLGEALGLDYGPLPDVARLRDHLETLLAEADGLAPALASVSADEALRFFLNDKKHGSDSLTVILIGEDGRLGRRQLARNGSSLERCKQAFAAVIREHSP